MDQRERDGRALESNTHDVPLLDAARERMLLTAAVQGDARAASELVQSHARLVRKIAARYRRGSLCWEDLVSEGVVGLMEAMRRFDVSQDTRFAAYACWWIRARIGQYALANLRLVRVPSTRNARSVARGLRRTERRLAQRLQRAPTEYELAQELGVDAADVTEVRTALTSSDLSLSSIDGQARLQVAAESETPEEALERGQQDDQRRRSLELALSKLSPRERRVVHEQYIAEHGRTLSELGADYGVSRQRLGQVLANARGKLKQAVAQVA